jgi:hypothetical protein
VVENIREEGLLDDERIAAIIDPSNLTGPSLLLGVSFDEKTDRTHTHSIRDQD